MKFSKMIKAVALASAFVASGASFAAAPWTFASGTGGLTFSAGALDALDASGSKVITGATLVNTTTGATLTTPNNAAYNTTTKNVALTFTNGTTAGDNVTSLTAANSLVTIRRTTGTVDDGDFIQRFIYLQDFKVDLATATISASVFSRDTNGASQSYGVLDIYKGEGVSGGNIVSSDGLNGTASGSFTGKLSIVESTANVFLTSLGLGTTGNVANLVKTAEWGTTSAVGKVTGTPSVPEPSTYALMGVGLVGIAAVARRRRAA